MPVVIGAKPESTFEDPIGLLGDCHRRVERFLSLLMQIASEVRGGPMSEEQRTSWATALRYFRDAAPKHTADEEESLFPRLRAMGVPEARAILMRLDHLQTDHVRAGRAHNEVDRLGQLWLDEGKLPAEQSSHLIDELTELTGLYQRHIAIEEDEVFPYAAKHVSAEERKAIGAEMAARRGLVNPRTELFRDGLAAL